MTTLLDAALAHVLRLRTRLATTLESRDLQRSSGVILAKTERRHADLRRLLADALYEASRLARDEGRDEQARELVLEAALEEHLAETLAERLTARP